MSELLWCSAAMVWLILFMRKHSPSPSWLHRVLVANWWCRCSSCVLEGLIAGRSSRSIGFEWGIADRSACNLLIQLVRAKSPIFSHEVISVGIALHNPSSHLQDCNADIWKAKHTNLRIGEPATITSMANISNNPVDRVKKTEYRYLSGEPIPQYQWYHPSHSTSDDIRVWH